LSISLAVPLQGPVSLNLPFAPTSAGDARRALVSWLRHQEASQSVVDDISLVVTELIANVVRHASPINDGELHVSWERVDDEVVLSVHDGGSSGLPVVFDPDKNAESGRGMRIVDSLSLRWRSERKSHVHSVHVHFALT